MTPLTLLLTTATLLAPTLAQYSAGGLALLTRNELDQTIIPGTSAILLSTPRSSPDQQAVCESLNETLWIPEEHDFSHSLNASIFYLEVLGQYNPSTVFHVAGGGPASIPDVEDPEDGAHLECRYIGVTGRVNYMDCKMLLPALCTQSAPLSSIDGFDRSPEYHVIQAVGEQRLVGFRDHYTFKFQGIRYANPVDRYEYSTVKDMSVELDDDVSALEYGAHCWQPLGEIQEGMSEDCLFMNIWTPYLPQTGTEGKATRKAVMVSIHGGGFVTGTGANPNFDGTNLASRGDVVVVSLNYRLGNLGNVAFDDGEHMGNFGMGDLITGLQWVQENIGYFGGDADMVTILGESAGAAAVHALMTSEKAKGLFHNAIELSGPGGWDQPGENDWVTYREPEFQYEYTTVKIAEEAGCGEDEDVLECLKAVDPETLVNFQTVARFPVKDMDIITFETIPLTPDAPHANVNYITGTNRNENAIFFGPPDEDTDPLEWMLNELSFLINGPFVVDVEDLTAEQAFNLTEHIQTLGSFTCMAHATAYSLAIHSAAKTVRTFEFTRSYSPPGYTTDWCSAPVTEDFPLGDPSQEYYKCHGGETFYVYGTTMRSGSEDRDGQDLPLMKLAVDYWTAFARTGNPNPTERYLQARKYLDTLDMVEEFGEWETVDSDRALTTRFMDMPSWQGDWSQGELCDILGLGLQFWEQRK